MASSNVVIAGTTYPSVPAVTLVKSGGGTSTFTDVSDTTAAAADVAQGKYFYTAAGVKTEGTASGGSVTPPETPTDAVIFYSIEPFTLRTRNFAQNWDGTLQYSTNNSSWSTWGGTTILTAVQSDGWYKLYLRGSSNTRLTGSSGNGKRWVFSGNAIVCKGNFQNLLNYNSTLISRLSVYAFQYLFAYCGNIDFDIELPFTSLNGYCYNYMFMNCSSLLKAPRLPATTVPNYAYSYMFAHCDALKIPPALPATTLGTYSYNYMFYNCQSLEAIPVIKATNLPNYCCSYMFYDTNAVKISTTQSSAYPYSYRIPHEGEGTAGTGSLTAMFSGNGGTFTGTPTINTTYYTSNTVIS